MEYMLIAAEQSTASYLQYELENLGRSMPVTVRREGCTVTAACRGEFARYFADEVKSLLCRWFDYCAKAAYLKEKLPNPGLNAAVYEAYLQSLTLIREDYRIQERMPLCAQVDVEALYSWYLEEIRGEWDQIAAAAERYSIADNRMAIRFVRKLRREIHPHMSYVKLTARENGYVFTDCAGRQLDFLEPVPPFSMLTDSIWLNAARVDIENRLTRSLPLLDLVRDVNPDMAVSLVLAQGE